ncbi:hypothetical protein GCM10022221_15670 [Actinocorallia aurea]
MGEDGLIPGTEGLAAEAEAAAVTEKKAGRSAEKKTAAEKKPAGVPEAAEELPVARVAVDVPLPHLDRVFDYLVPARLDAQAVPGCRVRVRFHGKLVDGFLLERVAESAHEGKFVFLERVVSAEPVLGPEIAALAREVADRYAGTFADVVRLAVPPRHARAEKRAPAEPAPRPAPPADPGPWAAYPAGPSYLSALADGRSPRAVWTALPGPDWPAALARAARATAASGRGVLIVVADGRHAARVAAALTTELADLPATPHPTSATPEPASATAEPASATPEPASATPESGSKAVEPGPEVVQPASVTAESGSEVVEPASAKEESGSVMAESGSEAGEPGSEAVQPWSAKEESGSETAEPASATVRPASAAVESGAATVQPGSAGSRAASETARPGFSAEGVPGSGEAVSASEVVPASRNDMPGVGDALGTEIVLGGAGSGVAEGFSVGEGELGGGGRKAARGRRTEGFVVLRAEDGPEKRYGEWLRILRGEARIVVGTRAAMFAPVRDLGLVALWDDGDDVHAEPHAPYPHAREVLVLRAHRAGAAALFGGATRTADATRLVETGWAHPLTAARETVREAMPRVRPIGEDAELARDEAARIARLPALAFRAARAALAEGPVLVQVPRRGYLPAIACAQCREPARCPACAGPLELGSAGGAPACRWCGAIATAWRCPECGGTRIRAVVVGAGRTAEELGRAFPGVTVRTSGRDAILAEVSGRPELVVATPGAEPVAEGGYAAALLLDGWAMLGRPDLRVAEEALRRWLNAAALVRPHGPVVLAADAGLPAVQAVVRWDPVTFAERELAERRELRFPPAARMASLTGAPAAIRDLLDHARLPADAELLGPVPLAEGRERALLRVPRTGSTDLARALKEAQAIRSARRAPDPVRVELDPLELL